MDVTVITQAGAEVLRNYRKPNERAVKEQSYKFPKGTTGKDLTVAKGPLYARLAQRTRGLKVMSR